jgi:hypothetical protein
MTFDTRGHTMMGVSPEAAVAALAAAGADAIGGNCGNGPDELLPVIEKMHAIAPDASSSRSRTRDAGARRPPRGLPADPATMAERGARVRGPAPGSSARAAARRRPTWPRWRRRSVVAADR